MQKNAENMSPEALVQLADRQLNLS